MTSSRVYIEMYRMRNTLIKFTTSVTLNRGMLFNLFDGFVWEGAALQEFSCMAKMLSIKNKEVSALGQSDKK